MHLAETQAEFVSAVLDAGRPAPASIEPGRDSERRLARFNIYRNNVFVTLIDVLEARFPAVSRLVGSEFFRPMARVYAGEQPSRATLAEYGQSFPAFIAAFGPADDVPYLSDVARIEWARHEAFNARDAEPLTAAGFAAIQPGPGTAIVLHPALSVVISDYPVCSIWEANAGQAAPLPLKLEDDGEAVLVTRPHHEVAVRRLDAGAARLIEALATGQTLGAAYDTVSAEAPDLDLEQVLVIMITAGGIVDGARLAPAREHGRHA